MELHFTASKTLEAVVTEAERTVLIVNNKGDKGGRGSLWFKGADDPRDVPPAGAIDGDFYLQSDANGTVYHLEGGFWAPHTTLVGPAGRGIVSFERTSGSGAPGTDDVYTITYTDDSTTQLTIHNGRDGIDGNDGRGIASIQRTSGTGAAGTTDTYTITFTDNTTASFIVTNGANGSVWLSGSGAPSNALGANGDYYLRTSNGDVHVKAAGAWSVVGNIRGPAGPDRLPTEGTGPLVMLNGVPFVGRRIDTWANRGTGDFVGQILIASDLRAAFYWDGTRWRPTQNRVRIFSATALAGAGLATDETSIRTVSIPAGLCEVGCLIRLVGVSTWSSTSASAKTIRVKVSNDAGANVASLNSITNRSRAVSSTSGFFGFNKPLIVRSNNQLWTNTLNIETESAAAEGITPNFINGIDCTAAWTMWLTHQKPQSGDTFDNQYFFVDIEFPSAL